MQVSYREHLCFQKSTHTHTHTYTVTSYIVWHANNSHPHSQKSIHKSCPSVWLCTIEKITVAVLKTYSKKTNKKQTKNLTKNIFQFHLENLVFCLSLCVSLLLCLYHPYFLSADCLLTWLGVSLRTWFNSVE